jgi:lysophospholipase L1-like esterase
LNQADGIHPTPAGVEIIVRNMLPLLEEVLAGIKKAGLPSGS